MPGCLRIAVAAIMFSGCVGVHPAVDNPLEASPLGPRTSFHVDDAFGPGVYAWLLDISEGALAYDVRLVFEDSAPGARAESAVNFLVPLHVAEHDLFPLSSGRADVTNWSHGYQFLPGFYHWFVASAQVGDKETYVNPNDQLPKRQRMLGGPVTFQESINLKAGEYLLAAASTSNFQLTANFIGATLVEGPLRREAISYSVFSHDHWNASTYLSSSGPIGPEMQFTSDVSFGWTAGARSYAFVQALGEDIEKRVALTAPDGSNRPLIEKGFSGKAAGIFGVGVTQRAAIKQVDLVTSIPGRWTVDIVGGPGHVDVRVLAFDLPSFNHRT